MSETKSTQKVPQKVGIGEKFAYLCTNIGNIPLMMLLSMFLTIFYTDVCGMDPTRVATMFLLSKVVDGISDPLMGFLMDRVPQTKFGRMRTMLILGTIICSINYMFVWFGPAWFPAAKYAIAYITYLLLGITFDIMDISLNSMLPLMTDDLKTRNQLSAIKMFGYMAGAMALSIVGPVIVADSTLNSYYILIFGSLAVVVVFSIGGALGIHERVKVEEGAEHRYNFIDLLKILITRPILVMLIVNLIMNTGNMLISGVQTYFYTYIIGNLALMSIVSVASTIASIPAMFISAVISDRIGKKKTFLIGLIVSAIGLAIRIPASTSLVVVVVSTIVYSFGNGLASTLVYGINADNSNYVEYSTGKHAEGAVASTSSFITKCAQGLGGAIPLYILAATGYVANAATQTDSAINGILMNFTYIPMIVLAVCAVIFGLFYNISKEDMEKINKTLTEKHQD